MLCCTQLLRKLRKFSTEFLRLKKVFLVFMFLQVDLFVYKMSCTSCWLFSNSLTSIIY